MSCVRGRKGWVIIFNIYSYGFGPRANLVLTQAGVCPVLFGVDYVLYIISWRRFGITKTIESRNFKAVDSKQAPGSAG